MYLFIVLVSKLCTIYTVKANKHFTLNQTWFLRGQAQNYQKENISIKIRYSQLSTRVES